MPLAESGSHHDTVTASRISRISEEDQGDLVALNAAVDRMRSHIASDPYVLTIPQDVEPRYHHNLQYQAMQWLHNAPFRYNEGEWMQYQTFFFHEHGKDMYVLHKSGLKEEREGVVLKPKLATGASTPSAGPKKKITLDAYKKKQSAVTPLREDRGERLKAAAQTKQPAVKGPVERVKAETAEVLAAVAEAEATDEGALVQSEKKDLKRKRDRQTDVNPESTESEPAGPNGTKPLDEPPKTDQPADQRAAKKARAASPPPVAELSDAAVVKPAKPTASPEEVAAVTEEDMESVLPAKLSPLAVPSLPARLSPTVPVNMLDTLKARTHLQPPSADKPAAASALRNGKLTPIRETESVVKRKSPVPRNGFRANSSSPIMRSDTEDRGLPVTSAPHRVLTPDLAREDEVAIGKALKNLSAKKLIKASLVVKLKYKKHQRDAIRRILKMRPQPDQITTVQPPGLAEEVNSERPANKTAQDKRDTNARGVAQRVGPATNAAKKSEEKRSTSAERRSHPGDEQPAEPPAKKQKRIPEPIDVKRTPITPGQPELQTPALPSSAQKSQQATPGLRKDYLSVAMQREISADSHKMNTPAAQPFTPTAASHTSQPNGIQPAHSSQPASKTSPQLAWESEQKRLETLGRELKHAATAHLKSVNGVVSKDPGPSNEQRLAAIKSVESLVAYLLAFTSADEAALAAEPKQNPSTKTWRSLQSYFTFVKTNCEPFPALVGLACLLGVVSNARILEITAQHPAEGPSRDTVIETCSMLQRAALDADAMLDLDELQIAFPKTWSERAKGVVDAVKLRPGEFGGRYKLPISVQTSPLQAARAGCGMLKEWIGKEGVEYQLRLGL